MVKIKQTQRLVAEVGGQCVVGLEDKELGRLFEEGGQVGAMLSKSSKVIFPRTEIYC